ncbi:30S ribosomal protein S4 [Halanaerobiaceae bacterium Z-7014]|uniref:Small ribosomal subunit protein uS4 n=1 Tax=Halonatronomonas betaini TaxID=2778430 RepID=A0A931B091_9FIRM|nr:30S ribosomal protein S4 [Halonatronomonas betaini]MBF8438038.1 30S ribosomal protein S4 [Halonatronomonas betaini]
MAKYTEAKCKHCRREGEKLYLKGERCYSEKCAFERRPYAPGEQGQGRRKQSEYGNQLREKQKVRRMYGMMEDQFRSTFSTAARQKGVTGENFLQLLETRLDNTVFRMGFATSRSQARQLVLHGHIYVNGSRVNIASYQVEEGDTISVKDASRKKNFIKDVLETNDEYNAPEWLSVNMEKAEGTVVRMPEREDIEHPINEQLIVEYYSL